MIRRELMAAALVLLALVATIPAYDRVFSDAAWRGPALVSATVAIGLAVVLRRLRSPAWLAGGLTMVTFVAVAPWLLALSDRPVWPGLDALGALRALVELGRTQLADTPAPAPALSGLMLLVVAGWWAIAHVGHELAVRWRRPGLALVALTVLWAAPLAVPLSGGTTWMRVVPFLGVAGFALLLTADDRHAGEQRLPVPVSGVAVGVLALAIAVAMPGLLPGYAEPAWVQLGAGTSPRGYQPIVDVSQRLGLPEERDVLRVRASQRTYLRLAGLESFDGEVWRLGPAEGGSYRPDPASLYRADGPLPAEQPATTTEQVQVDIEVLELENIYVPVPYQPVEVLGPIREEMIWSTEGGFLATWDTVEGDAGGEPRVGIREGIEYRVEAARPAPSLEELEATSIDDATLARYTELPRDYPELGEQAEAVYAAAGATTAAERALALQDWFAGPEGDFTYDLDVGALRGEDALTDFVLEDRVGYCEYFATAMAVMLRQTGIPARVATGFLPGRVTDEPSAEQPWTEYTVSTSDAHAWVEVLFPGAGWITFEPTPRSDDAQVVPTADDLTPTETMEERRAREAEEAGQDPTTDPTDPQPTENDPAQDALDDLLGDDVTAAGDDSGATDGMGSPTWALLITGLIALAIAVAVVTRHRRRHTLEGRTPEQRVLDAQRGLFVTAARHGVGRADHETSVEVMERWRGERRIDERGIPVAVAAQAAAFGGHLDATDADEVERLVADLAQMLRDSVTPRDRALAPFRLAFTGAERELRAVMRRVDRWRSAR